MNITVLWDVMPLNLVNVTNISKDSVDYSFEYLYSSIVMMETAGSFEMLVTSARLHGFTYQTQYS